MNCSQTSHTYYTCRYIIQDDRAMGGAIDWRTYPNISIRHMLCCRIDILANPNVLCNVLAKTTSPKPKFVSSALSTSSCRHWCRFVISSATYLSRKATFSIAQWGNRNVYKKNRTGGFRCGVYTIHFALVRTTSRLVYLFYRVTWFYALKHINLCGSRRCCAIL